MKVKTRRNRLLFGVLNFAAAVAAFGCSKGGLLDLPAQASVSLGEFAQDFAREALAALLL